MESPYNVMMSEFVFGFDAAQMLLTHGDVGGCSGFCLMPRILAPGRPRGVPHQRYRLMRYMCCVRVYEIESSHDRWTNTFRGVSVVLSRTDLL